MADKKDNKIATSDEQIFHDVPDEDSADEVAFKDPLSEEDPIDAYAEESLIEGID